MGVTSSKPRPLMTAAPTPLMPPTQRSARPLFPPTRESAPKPLMTSSQSGFVPRQAVKTNSLPVRSLMEASSGPPPPQLLQGGPPPPQLLQGGPPRGHPGMPPPGGHGGPPRMPPPPMGGHGRPLGPRGLSSFPPPRMSAPPSQVSTYYAIFLSYFTFWFCLQPPAFLPAPAHHPPPQLHSYPPRMQVCSTIFVNMYMYVICTCTYMFTRSLYHTV